MDTRKVAKEYRLSKWMSVIQEQQCSGQNIKDFCLDKGISRHAYFYWRRKIRSYDEDLHTLGIELMSPAP